MKSIIFAFVTLVAFSDGLRVSPLDKGLTNIPQGYNGIMTYTPGTGWEWMDQLGLSDFSRWLRLDVLDMSEEAEGRTVVVRAHHMSGINLAKSVGECIAEHANRDEISNVVLFPERIPENTKFTEQTLATAHRPTLHFVRKLDAWVISWYQFAKTVYGEDFKYQDWMTHKGAMQEVHGGDQTLMDWVHGKGVTILPQESVKDFLRRVPPQIGLGVAYREMTSDVLPQAINFATHCQNNLMCQQVCMENFALGAKKYADKWGEIFMKLGVNLEENDKLKLCVEKQRMGANPEGIKYDEVEGDSEGIKFAEVEGHSRVRAKDVAEFTRYVTNIDKELGYEFGKAEGLFACEVKK